MKRLDAPVARTYAGAASAAGPLLYVRSTRRAKLGEWVRIEGAGQEGRRGQVIDVGDEEIGAAVRYLYLEQGLRVEPSGAVGVAALLTGKLRPDTPTAVILSGGNVDPTLFQTLVAG